MALYFNILSHFLMILSYLKCICTVGEYIVIKIKIKIKLLDILVPETKTIAFKQNIAYCPIIKATITNNSLIFISIYSYLFAMSVFMCVYLRVVQILLSSVVCCSTKTLNHGLNHLKIHTAHQFCGFQYLLFSPTKYVKAETFGN